MNKYTSGHASYRAGTEARTCHLLCVLLSFLMRNAEALGVRLEEEGGSEGYLRLGLTRFVCSGALCD